MMNKRRVFPTTLDNIRQVAPSPPKKTRTRRQLKRWLEANPVEAYPMEDILNLQAVHCAHVLWHEDTSSKDEPHPNEGSKKRKGHESDSESECSAKEPTNDESDGFDVLGYYPDQENAWADRDADRDIDELSEEKDGP